MKRFGHKIRRLILVLALFAGAAVWLTVNPESYDTVFKQVEGISESIDLSNIDLSNIDLTGLDLSNLDLKNFDPSKINLFKNTPKATEVLEKLEVKGRAPKTGYSREEFYQNWPSVEGCNLRQRIIKREFGDTAVLDDNCSVIAGEYDEPYTGEHQKFEQKAEISVGIQIDHVVALSDAWQKGAQNLSATERLSLATDPLNLLAVDSKANQAKSDGDAATWLPSNKPFRCQYVARQVSVKYKYHLWVTEAEKAAITKVLENCPNESAIGVSL